MDALTVVGIVIVVIVVVVVLIGLAMGLGRRGHGGTSGSGGQPQPKPDPKPAPAPDPPAPDPPAPGTTFDYVIIGSGPAGAEAARLLTESGEHTVLLLEAGEDHDSNPAIADSAQALNTQSNDFYRFFWQQAIQNNTTLTPGEDQYTGGYLFGGSSSINGEQWVVPSDAIKRKWHERAGGDADWSPEAVNRVVKKIIHATGTDAYYADTHGPLAVTAAPTSPADVSQPNADFVQAVVNSGLAGVTPNYNAPETPIGAFEQWQLTQHPSPPYSRASSSTDMLTPDVRARKNLTILARAYATFAHFTSKRADGVNYTLAGVGQYAQARLGVLCALGQRSPLFLQLSGVGDAKELAPLLSAAGRGVIADLPAVGKHLQNDGAVFAVVQTPDYPVSAEPTAIYDGGAFLPDPNHHHHHHHHHHHDGDGHHHDRDRPRFTEVLNLYGPPGTLNIAPIMLDVESEGHAKITSADPFIPVAATTRALENPNDRRRWRDVFTKQIVPIVHEMHKINRAYKLLAPTKEQLADPDELDAYVAANYNHSHHWVGTCRMGTDPKTSVVDASLKVHGLEGLYVIDASAVPVKPDGNTQSCAYIFGHIGAKKLLREHCKCT
jgi:choline dehydrogenase